MVSLESARSTGNSIRKPWSGIPSETDAQGYLEFRTVEVTALEQGCWHIEHMSVIRRENEVFGAFWQWAHRSDFTLGIIGPSNFAFDYHPASTTGTGYTRAYNSIAHGRIIGQPTRTSANTLWSNKSPVVLFSIRRIKRIWKRSHLRAAAHTVASPNPKPRAQSGLLRSFPQATIPRYLLRISNRPAQMQLRIDPVALSEGSIAGSASCLRANAAPTRRPSATQQNLSMRIRFSCRGLASRWQEPLN